MAVFTIIGMSAILVGLYLRGRGKGQKGTHHTKMHPNAKTRKPSKPKNAAGSKITLWNKLLNKARK